MNTCSTSVVGTTVQDERVQRLSNRFGLLRIEFGLKTAFKAAQHMSGIRVFLANHIVGQLVVLNESHVRSLSPRELASTSVDEAGVILPKTASWPLSCARRSISRHLQLASDPVASIQVLRLVGCGGLCQPPKMRPTHTLLLQPEARQASNRGSSFARLCRHPYYRHPSNECSHRAPTLPYSPCFPRSLARCYSRARRHGALLLRLRRPPGYGFHLRRTLRKCRAWHTL